MRYKILFQIVMLLAVFFHGNAQEVLTVDEAVQIALKNNYDIKIASNDAEVSKENKSIANAGMLPKLDATLTQSNTIQNTKQTQATGEVRELDNAKNNSLVYGVSLGWTVFDGFRMFARYDQLKALEKQGEVQLKMMVLTKVSDVMTTYYDLVQQQQLVNALDTTIVISKQRLKTAENRFTIGKASKLEVLNAQVDLNTDLSNLLKQKELFETTKIRLNELLARDVATDFKVVEEVAVDDTLKLVDLNALVEKQNPQLQMALLNKTVAELDLKQVRANRYPTVQLNSGYTFNRSESSLGFVSQSSGRGFNYGVSASLNIFNGFLQNRNEKIAKLQVENSTLVIEQQKQTITSQLASLFQTYLTNVELAKLEENNEAIAKRNLEITLEKFRIGTITTIEFRSAQQNYVNAIARNSSAKFQAKISEVMLNEIAGNIKF
ncbi:outer membrane efflux protein [Flavobacterium saliperosum S13]|uniref:Outer membrane protein TolC n=2 Tax=Flavobacterium saliperosum TaxID=329186 RepID=A0A1G4V6X8_9FLAO|nr:TolC family protein [Flavobacterium saliperosum]ESU27864.1 outer membrane efflux protein [Flavobacterium saliperosum S13]SCX01603.1 Outer membrane protein TolC [Flavobacterium saliperosum]